MCSWDIHNNFFKLFVRNFPEKKSIQTLVPFFSMIFILHVNHGLNINWLQCQVIRHSILTNIWGLVCIALFRWLEALPTLSKIKYQNCEHFPRQVPGSGTNFKCYGSSHTHKNLWAWLAREEVRHEVSVERWGVVFPFTKMKKEGIPVRKNLCGS